MAQHPIPIKPTNAPLLNILETKIYNYTLINKGFKMEMILNEYDMIVGARFENGTIQDYVDDANTYGLIRIKDTTANWFLFNKDESDADLQELYNKVTEEEHFVQNDFGEEIIIFNKNGDESFEELALKIDEYLDDGLGQIL